MSRQGSNASGVRRYNERLILSTIHRMGEASKADIARETGLSPQAALRIVEALEEEGRILPTTRRIGGRGQPSMPYRINGASGHTIGVEIGRDHVACAMLDFGGRLLAHASWPENLPEPRRVLECVAQFRQDCAASPPAGASPELMGIGIVMPWFLGEWQQETGIDAARAAQWSSPDLEDLLRTALPAPVLFDNDGNAAALAELLCGAGTRARDFLYIHLGNFVGGGLVLDGEIRRGRHGNAAALASLPLSRDAPGAYLLRDASIFTLPPEAFADPDRRARWLDRCTGSLAFAISGVNSLLDLDAVIIGGTLEPALIDAITSECRDRLALNPPPDFFQPAFLTGQLGARAPVVGAALLPLHSAFSPNLAALLKAPLAYRADTG
ncbi:ROK family transcriptional regulator [Novosphingobium sp. 1949]|uniref:ROK family transcriptional regulator n=1 Tax=Novosphingobium organovorum TaxID=2930092 RepID=A0ABT0BGN8_9SPHN|nr:ROK family transcriptional regulator [Novosphingobium organovorum]MCJ2184237.1 ROK family transcriptional regulator [Novosphingobium organovorum]